MIHYINKKIQEEEFELISCKEYILNKPLVISNESFMPYNFRIDKKNIKNIRYLNYRKVKENKFYTTIKPLKRISKRTLQIYIITLTYTISYLYNLLLQFKISI